jgi:uncharacterized phage protein (TIGR02220 family)
MTTYVNGYTNVPNKLWLDENLDAYEKLIVCFIESYSFAPEKQFTYNYIASCINLSQMTVRRKLKLLQEKDFITMHKIHEDGACIGFHIENYFSWRVVFKAPPKVDESKLEKEDPSDHREQGGSDHKGQGGLITENTKEVIKENNNIYIEEPTATEDMGQAKEVLKYLNEKTQSQFREIESNLKKIQSCIKKYPVGAAQMVIDLKVKDWLGDNTFSKYLRPTTLFRASNFDNYYNAALKAKEGADKVSKDDKETIAWFEESIRNSMKSPS